MRETTSTKPDFRPSGAEVLRWAFGPAIPAEELEAWLAATPRQREGVLARLEAIRRWMEAGRRAPEQVRLDLARGASLELGRLRNLVTVWRVATRREAADGPAADGRRSLRLLGLRTEPQRSPKWRKGAEARRIAAEVVAEIDRLSDSSDSTGLDDGSDAQARRTATVESVVTAALMDQRLTAAPVSRTTLREIVRAGRRERDGPRRLGRALTFDQIPLAVCSHLKRAYKAVLILDLETRFVLGAALDDVDPGRDIFARAALDAARRLESEEMSGVTAHRGDPQVTVAVSDGAVMDSLRLFAALPAWKQHGSARGRTAMAVIGKTIGRIRLRPALDRKRNLPECSDDVPLVTSEEAHELLELAVGRHNAALLNEEKEKPGVAEKRCELAAMLRQAAAAMDLPLPADARG